VPKFWSAAAAVMLLASAAAAQCDVWLPTPGDSSLYNGGLIRAIDHDGPGPLPPTLYAANPLRRWTGLAWEALPVISTANASVSCMEPLNDPAGGLPPGQLLIGGSFVSADGSSRVLASWDGQTLNPIGPSSAADFSTGATVYSFTTWDPDGPGPLAPWIVAGGTFTRIGGVTATNIAAWDGNQWRALGTGLTGRIVTLTSFDPDGDGPALPLLIAGGGIGPIIKSWNGSTWQTLGAGFGGTGTVASVAVFDPDGPGPAPSSLWAAGSFTNSGATSVPGLARWSGAAWVAPGAGYPGTSAQRVRVLDLDGPGPQLPKLIVGGAFGQTAAPQFSRTLAIFDGQTWTPLDGSPNGSNAFINSAEVLDPDGSGPRGLELIASGTSTQIGWPIAIQYPNLGAWDGQRWMSMGGEFVGPVKSFAWLDETGDGHTPPALYAAGAFSAVNGGLADSIARWDGAKWVGLGTPHGHSIRQLITHDPDGPGPQAPWILGVEPNISTAGVLRFQNGAWTSISTVTPPNGWTAASFDDDGAGPIQPKLFGSFAGSLSRYNGLSWTSADPSGGYMCLFEHLEPGAARTTLYGIGGASAIRRWNGLTWSSVVFVDPSNNGAVARAVSWDPDGDGPRAAEIVVGAVSPNGAWNAESYDGTRWLWLAPNSPNPVAQIVWTPSAFDPDGPDPVAPQLVMGLGAGFGSLFTRLVNGTWVLPNPGIRDANPANGEPNNSYVQAFATVDPDGDGPLPTELWIGGWFTHANGVPARNWARWRLSSMPPALTQHPASAQACLSAPASFTVAAASTTPLTFQWRTTTAPNVPAGWAALTDGPLMISGQQVATISGASTATLTVQSTDTPFTADFRCMVVNTCGSVETVTAHLVVAPCCGSADFNHDDDSGTDADIESFFACLAGNCCAACDSADFNGDGDSGTDTDIESFFRVLAGGPC
jgi:hypothetical protein